MKFSQLLLMAAFAAGCSSDPPPAEPEPAVPAPAAAPAPAPEATTGERPAPRAPEHELPAADAREAARSPVTAAAVEAGVNVQAAVLKDFETRLQGYMQLHDDAARGSAKPKETEDPGEIAGRQEILAARIAALRTGAKHGDIFTAEIRDRFRRMLAPELKGEEGRDAKEVLKDDAPPSGSVPLKVNAEYPDGLPRPTVPANLLLNLPRLPKVLVYRIVGKHLVLLDIDANLIVDYIPNAIA